MDIRPISNTTPQPVTHGERPVHAAEVAVAAKPIAAAPVESAAAVQQPGSIPNMDQLAQAVKNINKALKDQSQDLEFSIDSDSDRTIIKVVDNSTKEVIRQIPSEEALELSKALDSLQKGLLIRQKA